MTILVRKMEVDTLVHKIVKVFIIFLVDIPISKLYVRSLKAEIVFYLPLYIPKLFQVPEV